MKSLRKGARWMRSRITGGGIILGYHRIAEDPFDPYSICVTSRNFQDHLDVLRHETKPLSLHALVQGLKAREIPPRSVVLTLDDGYADNLLNAKSLLEHYQIPATIFVSTGYIGGRFWWDVLAEQIMADGADLESMAALAEGVSRARRAIRGGNLASAKGRNALILSLYRMVLFAPPAERDTLLEQVRVLGGGEIQSRPEARALRSDELVELACGDLIEIGAHSHSHPVLAALPGHEQRDEIIESKRRIGEILGTPPVSFSCPNGSWSSEIRAILVETGFECACISEDDVVTSRTDPFRLPRFWIGDWGKDQFVSWLRRKT